MSEPKTWKDVWDEFCSPAFWWMVVFFIGIQFALAAVNKWVYHLPGFPKW